MSELDNFYFSHPEPVQSCLLALRDIILTQDSTIVSTRKYGMPFFIFRKKMFCYLWYHKKLQMPYIGFVEGNLLNYSELIQEKRSRMKIMLIDPGKDIPKEKIRFILSQAIKIYIN